MDDRSFLASIEPKISSAVRPRITTSTPALSRSRAPSTG
jgi:hypothetical protein